jgi:ribosomal protein S27AE
VTTGHGQAARRPRTTPIPSPVAPPPLSPHRRQEAPEFVFIQREKCPSCGATDIEPLGHTTTDADGIVTRRRRCKVCGHRYKLILE